MLYPSIFGFHKLFKRFLDFAYLKIIAGEDGTILAGEADEAWTEGGQLSG